MRKIIFTCDKQLYIVFLPAKKNHAPPVKQKQLFYFHRETASRIHAGNKRRAKHGNHQRPQNFASNEPVFFLMEFPTRAIKTA